MQPVGYGITDPSQRVRYGTVRYLRSSNQENGHNILGSHKVTFCIRYQHMYVYVVCMAPREKNIDFVLRI
jgi:hypothetical protein